MWPSQPSNHPLDLTRVQFRSGLEGPNAPSQQGWNPGIMKLVGRAACVLL